MKPKPILDTRRPEKIIQDGIIKQLRYLEWTVMPTHGNLHQKGFPDLYVYHVLFGQRWIEVKQPDHSKSKFTGAQQKYFKLMDTSGIGIWILTGSDENNIDKLFKSPNWKGYYMACLNQ